jgi:amidohydrolase
MITIQKIKTLARKYHKETIRIRRHLHMYPELSFQEWKTSEFIAGELKTMHIPFQDGIAGTGIIGTIEGKNPASKVIALRAEMDALPISEANRVSYRSKIDGVMHACGHDVHVASLLGSARILQEIRNAFEGTVLLVFQPGEELIPGGAKQILDEGVLQKQRVQAIFAQHVAPELEVGQIGFRSGIYMASNDEIYLTIKGKGGHAAFPKETTDTVLIASRIIVALKESINDERSGGVPTILSFGKLMAHGATNVIPGEVSMEGTFRTFDETWRQQAHRNMKEIAEELARDEGGSCDFRVVTGYPFLTNNSELTAEARESASRYVGKGNIVSLDLRMSSEDFAYYAQVFPATLYRIGIRNPGVKVAPSLHSPTFDIDESVLEPASGNMAWIALSNLLKKNENQML